jgi:hypothetical protein
MSEKEDWRFHLNEKLFAQQGQEGNKGRHFGQEVTEETEDSQAGCFASNFRYSNSVTFPFLLFKISASAIFVALL